MAVGRINDPKFVIDHRGKEIFATFGLPIRNENSAISVLLPYFFVIVTVYLKEL